MTTRRVRRELAWLLLAACGALIACLVIAEAGAATSTGAYLVHGVPGSDNAGPPIDALAHARLDRLPGLQTVMGLTSILWRAPFAAAATALGAGARVTYALGAAACMLPLVGVVAWLAAREPSARQLGLAALGALVMLIGTPTVDALRTGHPEGALKVALELAAVIAAMGDRRTIAALALGLAIGTKQTALLAVPAVLVALPGGRARALIIAAVVGMATSVPLAMLDPHAFTRADASIGPITMVGPMSGWWPLAGGAHQLPLGLRRPLATAIGLALAAAGVAACGFGLRRGRPSAPGAHAVDPLALLALCGVLRCLADPADLMYYLVSALVPLVVWEVGTLRRPPTASFLLWGTLALCYGTPLGLGGSLVQRAPGAGIAGCLLALTLLAGYLAVRTFRRPAAGAPGVPGVARWPRPMPAIPASPPLESQRPGLRSTPDLKPA